MIDDHAHPFSLAPTDLRLGDVTLDVAQGQPADARRADVAGSRLAVEAMTVRLARHLGCAVDELGAARAAAAADWPAYVRGLFSEVGLTGMLLDPAAEGLEGGVSPYAEMSGAPVWELVRIEPTVDRLIGEGRRAKDIVDAVELLLSDAHARGAVGAKTVLAYRTGLAVDPAADLAAAERSLDSDLPVRRRAKPLRDLVTRRVLAVCADLGLPLQVHTGFGDSELRLSESEPILLDDLLRTPEGEAAQVVLIHGGFPWHEQVAYLAAVRAGVWVDFSLSNLMSPATTADRLLRVLDLCPAGRLLLGSDGHGTPETHWFGLGVLRDAWFDVRRRLDGTVRSAWLDETQDALFTGNARRLYGLR